MAEINSYPEGLIDAISNLTNATSQKAKHLRAEADRAEHTRQVCERLLSYVQRRWPLNILNLLDKETGAINQVVAEVPGAAAFIEELLRSSRDQAEAIIRHFPSLMEEACNLRGLPLDRDSRHPRYKFEGGFFHLDVDERRKMAKLSDYESQLKEMPADVGAIVEAVESEHKRVFGRDFDGGKFLKKLRKQYTAILKKGGLPEGSSLPIRRLTGRLGKNEKGFRTDEFLIDLSRLAQQGAVEVDGYVLDLQQTKDTHQGMLLHGPAGRGYVGFITFRKALP